MIGILFFVMVGVIGKMMLILGIGVGIVMCLYVNMFVMISVVVFVVIGGGVVVMLVGGGVVIISGELVGVILVVIVVVWIGK